MNGPSELLDMNNLAPGVQRVIRELRQVTTGQLQCFRLGNVLHVDEAKKMLDIYFMFLTEVNRVREMVRSNRRYKLALLYPDYPEIKRTIEIGGQVRDSTSTLSMGANS